MLSKYKLILDYLELDYFEDFGKYRLSCPFHDEYQNSAYVYPDGSYHCYGCGIYLSIIELIAKVTDQPLDEIQKQFNYLDQTIQYDKVFIRTSMDWFNLYMRNSKSKYDRVEFFEMCEEFDLLVLRYVYGVVDRFCIESYIERLKE